MTACSVPICSSVFPRECGCDAAASSKSSSSTTTTGSLTSGLNPDSKNTWCREPGAYVDDFGELGRDIVRFRVTVGPVCGATGPVCSGTVSGTKEQEETVATGPPAEACAPGGVGGAGKPRGTVLGPAEKFEAVKVASSLGLQGPSAPIGAQLLATGGSEDAPSVYHANLLASSNASVLQQPVLASLNTPALASMQASAEANSLDIQAMQSMDWLFKKERIYLLAQFWQQVSARRASSRVFCDPLSYHGTRVCTPSVSSETDIMQQRPSAPSNAFARVDRL